MQLCARLCKNDNFPCLAHILNIIVRRFILQNTEAEDAQNDDFGFDPDIEVTPPDHAYESTIQKVRAIVRKIKKSSMLQEKLKRKQRTMDSSSKSIIIDIETRWNYLYMTA